MAEPNHLERYTVGPADFDPRVMDPMTEERRWREEVERNRESAFETLTSGGINALGALGGFAFSNPATSRARTAVGRWMFGAPGERTRSVIGNTLGWGNVGFGGQRAYEAYVRGQRAREAEEMASRWERGVPPDYQTMVGEAFRPYPPVSR